MPLSAPGSVDKTYAAMGRAAEAGTSLEPVIVRNLDAETASLSEEIFERLFALVQIGLLPLHEIVDNSPHLFLDLFLNLPRKHFRVEGIGRGLCCSRNEHRDSYSVAGHRHAQGRSRGHNLLTERFGQTEARLEVERVIQSDDACADGLEIVSYP